MMRVTQLQEFPLPLVEQMSLIRHSFLNNAPKALQNYRARAQMLYQDAPFNAKEWSSMPLFDTNWDALNIQDFYITKTRLSNGVLLLDTRDFIKEHAALADKFIMGAIPKNNAVLKIMLLIEACFNRGAVLIIPAHAKLAVPLDIAQLLGGYRQSLLIEKIIVIVGDNAAVTINDTLSSSRNTAHTVLRSIEYHIGDYADVTVNHQQDLALDTFEVSQTNVTCGKQSSFNYTTTITGSCATKTWLNTALVGAHAKATIRGVYALSEQQSLDVTTTQVHNAPSTESDLVMKGGLAGKSSAYYQGTIAINEQGKKAVARQNNHNILMSAQAKARSRPTLEVLTNDVHCVHGSAVGQLDKEQLCYLQSRGLNPQQAQRLILEGFFADVLPIDCQELVTTLTKKLCYEKSAS